MKLGTLFGQREKPKAVFAVPDAAGRRRIAAARACKAWTEIDADWLVQRGRDYLVDPETDAVYRPYPGDAFSPSAAVLSDMVELFYVVRDGDVRILQRQPETWSEITARRAAR